MPNFRLTLQETCTCALAKQNEAEQLVWYARKHPNDHPSWDELRPDTKKLCLDAKAHIEEMFPNEVDKLRGESGDFYHGFNSGVLAALRFIYTAATEGEEAAKNAWPELDT